MVAIPVAKNNNGNSNSTTSNADTGSEICNSKKRNGESQQRTHLGNTYWGNIGIMEKKMDLPP